MGQAHVQTKNNNTSEQASTVCCNITRMATAFTAFADAMEDVLQELRERSAEVQQSAEPISCRRSLASKRVHRAAGARFGKESYDLLC